MDFDFTQPTLEEGTMKKILFALLLAICASSVFAQKYIVVRDGTGFGTMQALPVDTGIRIEAGLVGKLTDIQLNAIIKHAAEIPLNTQTRTAGWNKYLTHLTVEEGYTEVAVLQDKEIIKVAKEKSVRWERFNPTFILGLLFIIGVSYASQSFCRKTSPEGYESLGDLPFLCVTFAWGLALFDTVLIPGINPLTLLFGLIPFVLFFLGIVLQKRWYLALSILTMVGYLASIFTLTAGLQ